MYEVQHANSANIVKVLANDVCFGNSLWHVSGIIEQLQTTSGKREELR